MKHGFLTISLLIFIVPSLSCATSSSTATYDTSFDHRAIHSSTEPITHFNAEHYSNVGFEVRFWPPKTLAAYKNVAPLITKKGCNEHKAFAYVRTLNNIEQSGLLQKPFKSWRLADIIQVNAWLTDLHPKVKHPGAFRTDIPAPLYVRPFTKDEYARLEMVDNDPSLVTEADRQLLRSKLHPFSPADDVLPMVTKMLCEIKETLLQLKPANPILRQAHHEINIVGFLHQYIRAIRPWPKRNKATARVLGNIILMQHGVEPPTFEDIDAYRTAASQAICTDDQSPLAVYIRDIIVARQQWKARPPREAQQVA